MDILIIILFAVINIINLSIAISVLANANKNKTNILFFWTLLTLVLWNITLFFSLPLYPEYTETSLIFFARLAYGFSILENLFIVLFSKEIFLPLNEITLFGKKYTIPSWLVSIITIEAILLFSLTVFTPLLYTDIHVDATHAITDYFGPLYDWYSLRFLIFTILPISILFFKSRISTGIVRKKLFFLVIGFSVLHILAILFNIILPGLGNPSYYLVGGISSGLIGAFILYIVFKYRFLGTKIVLWKIIRIVIQLLIVASIVVFTKQIISTTKILDSFDYFIISAVAICTFFITNSFFFKNFYLGKSYANLHSTMQELIATLKTSITVKEFKSVLASTFESKLGITNTDIYGIEQRLRHVDIAQYPQNELTTYLETEKREIVTEEWKFREIPLTPLQLKSLVFITILEAHVCIPLFHQQNLIGIFVLGPKISQEAYNTDEIEAFRQLADYISSFLITVSLFKQEQQTLEKLQKTKELSSANKTAQRLMHDMKNSIQSAYAIIREIKNKKDIRKVDKVQEKLLDMEDSLRAKDSELQIGNVELHDFFIQMVDSFTELFQEKSIEYKTYIDVPIGTYSQCDRKKYKSIFENLLYNAYKFTAEKGKVTCRVVLNTSNTELLITISNTGAGIPEPLKEQIFEKGYTTDSSQGSGHGLDIVKTFVEQHKGEIHEFGTEGVDTVFTIKLPINSPEILIF